MRGYVKGFALAVLLWPRGFLFLFLLLLVVGSCMCGH